MKLAERWALFDERVYGVINDEWQTVDKIQSRAIEWTHPVVKKISYTALVRTLKRLANDHKIVLVYDEDRYRYVARRMF